MAEASAHLRTWVKDKRPAKTHSLKSRCFSRKTRSMTLKIQKSTDCGFLRFTLSGRIEAQHMAELQQLVDFEAEAHNIVLDLEEVKLVDRVAVGFLARCESRGTKLVNCPAYIREWISRERDV